MTNVFKVLIVVFLAWGNSVFSAPLTSVNFEGLTKTKKDFLQQLIKSKIGLEYDSLTVLKDEQALKNLNLFFSVNSKTIYNDSLLGYDLTFIIKEANYVYPFISVSGFEDAFKVQLGINSNNWRGRNQTIGFLYQYYDRHSISVYQKTPRHKNGKTGHEISLSKYSTIEPLYFENTSGEFNFDNYSISLGGYYWLSPKWVANIGGMLMREEYKQLNELAPGATFKHYVFSKDRSFSLSKHQVRSGLTFNNVNQHFEFFNGLRVDLYGEVIQTKGNENASFIKSLVGIRYYKRFGKGNLAFKYSLGIATNNESPFSPFVLDGFLNVRGIGNRTSRGTAENIINMEYRHSIITNKYLILQMIAFTDIGSLREPGADLETLYYRERMNYYSGVGIRVHSKIFYKAIFRVDYATNLQNTNERSFSFGLGQFF